MLALIQVGSISTSSILLVPYEASHVPTYHEWMKDEQIQAETASEPLTLEEEYAMQLSWRTDADKLTFIACLLLPYPLPPPTTSLTPPSSSSSPSPNPPSSTTTPHILIPGTFDSPSHIIGDVNLFLTPSHSTSPSPSPSPSTTHPIIGELELMIAPTLHRRKGHGRNTILAFLSYITTHLPSILAEYGQNQTPPIPKGDVRLEGLRVKIGKENEGSLRLFRGLGFGSLEGGEGEEVPNYFGEVELWYQGEVSEEGMRGLRERFGVEGYMELEYGDRGEGRGVVGHDTT
ncbi:hypothetical protein DL98DRAFT_656276 [Cadophora sp. DSE1049]|nr:hypothetical protein DL98DRAFT_656276 [Cadophora sp. DSE1049]